MNKFFTSLFIGSMVFSLILAGVVSADSTIGTNISTTGTLKVTTGGATAVLFQNAAGTNLFIFDHTNLRLGIGATPGTTFEVQGTASASYFLTGNTIQVGGFASVAYNRFGTATTNHANYISTTNDILVSGDVEIRGSASFGSTASVSGIFFMNDGRFRPNANSATAFRFQNTAGSTDVLTIDTTNTRVGVGSIGTLDTLFEVGGTASVATLFATTKIVAGSGTASASAYTAEFVSTGTTSVLFGGSSTTLGTCLQLKNTTGQPVYARVVGTTWTVNAQECR